MTNELKLWQVYMYKRLPSDKRTKRTVWRYLTVAESAAAAVARVHEKECGPVLPDAYRALACEPGDVISWSLFSAARDELIPESDRVAVPTGVSSWAVQS